MKKIYVAMMPHPVYFSNAKMAIAAMERECPGQPFEWQTVLHSSTKTDDAAEATNALRSGRVVYRGAMQVSRRPVR